MRKQTRSGGRSTALRPPCTELLGIAPLNGTAKNGVTKRHQTFYAVPDDFLSASLRCPAASHSDGDNYEPSMQQLRLSVTFSWYKPPSYVKNDWIDKVMRRALAPELKSALGPSKNPIGFARYASYFNTRQIFASSQLNWFSPALPPP
jgi:hypothetical protein